MAKKRDQIKMSNAEVAEFLARERVANVATNGRDGWPHATALWFVMRDAEPWSWTYRKSQKVKNLERDPRATLMIETGEEYHELRGLMIEADAEVNSDFDTVFQLAQDLNLRYTPGLEQLPDEGLSVLEKQAAKRVAIRFRAKRTSSWDHRKLGGTY